MYRIRKKFHFEGAHVLKSAYSTECKAKIHGHSYVVEVFLQTNILDETGMIIDFKLLKENIQHIFDMWDHACVVYSQDDRQHFIDVADIKTEFNPTAENMSHYFYWKCREFCNLIYKVRVHETNNGYAEFEGGM